MVSPPDLLLTHPLTHSLTHSRSFAAPSFAPSCVPEQGDDASPCPHGARCRFHHGTRALALAAWPDAAMEVQSAEGMLVEVSPPALQRPPLLPQSAEKAVRMAAEEGLILRPSTNVGAAWPKKAAVLLSRLASHHQTLTVV